MPERNIYKLVPVSSYADLKKNDLFLTFEDGVIRGGGVYKAVAKGTGKEDTPNVDAELHIALVL